MYLEVGVINEIFEDCNINISGMAFEILGLIPTHSAKTNTNSLFITICLKQILEQTACTNT